MREKLLPYGRQSIDEDDIAAVVEQLRSDWLTQGPTVARFEAALTEITGARFAVAVANGTAALHLACIAAGVGPGDAGFTSTITFVASANAIRYAGGTPRLIDVDPETGLISPAGIRSAAAESAASGLRPRVIIPVDFAGTPADLPAIRTVADDLGARVIEDAAHSLGAEYVHDGRVFRAGSCAHTDMAILSFHPVKHLTTGEGGAITTNDPDLYQRLQDLRTHGITKDPKRLRRNDGPWYYEQDVLGFNYRITDLQCALGISQAKKFPAFLARRRAIAQRYDRAFAANAFRDQLKPLAVPADRRSAYHLYVVRLAAGGSEPTERVAERRRAVFMRLRDQNIGVQVHYIPVHHQPDFERNGFSVGRFDGAEDYYASCVSIPMFPAMTDRDVDDVIEAVRHALDARP